MKVVDDAEQEKLFTADASNSELRDIKEDDNYGADAFLSHFFFLYSKILVSVQKGVRTNM